MRPSSVRRQGVIGRLALVGGLCLGLVAAAPALAGAAGSAGWPIYGGNYGNDRYSPLGQINAGNVKQLRVAYAFQVGALRANEATPLVIGETMYLASSWGPKFVYALDAKSGEMKWQYRSGVPEDVIQYACCDVDTRGVAYDNGRLFVGRLDGYLVALDAATGKEVWKTQVVDYKSGAVITSPPLVVHGKVITGHAGGEYGVRGRLAAYDEETGKPRWTTYTIPGPGEPGNDTWKGDSWKHGGASTWLSGSYDPRLNIVYWGTSNPGPWDAAVRSTGDSDYGRYTNLYSSSVLALNPDTGKILWHIQYTPADAWDYDGVNESVLADLRLDGRTVPALMHADRNGFFYVADRRSGRLISAKPYVHVNWAKGISLKTGRPIEVADKRPTREHKATNVCPSLFGGRNWQPMSYSPQTRLVYISTNNMCMDIKGVAAEYHRGVFYMGTDFSVALGSGGFGGEVVAWDPARQKKVWGIKEGDPYNGGVLSTAGGLVFYGTYDGWFKAADARTGKVLWKFFAGSGFGAGPMSFAVDGRQYVAVLSGRPQSAPTFMGELGKKMLAQTPQGGTLFVFSQ